MGEASKHRNSLLLQTSNYSFPTLPAYNLLVATDKNK
jgi:hypothetical protein